MNIADIITEFGAYYINSGQNTDRLVTLLRHKTETEQLFSTLATQDTVYRAGKATIDRVLQPFQKAWTPIATAEFTPIAIQQFKSKIDFQDYPDDLEASWLGFLSDGNLDRKQWPFVRYVVEKLIIPQYYNDKEINETWDSAYAAPTPGTAGTAGTMRDGINTMRKAQIDSGAIDPITTGALEADPSDLVDQIEEFCDNIPILYWKQPMILAVAPEVERRFLRGYAKKYGQYTTYTENTKGMVDMTNVSVKGLPSMIGTEVIWCSPTSNLKRLVKRDFNGGFQIENIDRQVKLYTDMWDGLGWMLGELFFTNDIELS